MGDHGCLLGGVGVEVISAMLIWSISQKWLMDTCTLSGHGWYTYHKCKFLSNFCILTLLRVNLMLFSRCLKSMGLESPSSMVQGCRPRRFKLFYRAYTNHLHKQYTYFLHLLQCALDREENGTSSLVTAPMGSLYEVTELSDI